MPDKYKHIPPACAIAFVCLRFLISEGFWNYTRYKRPITRLFYMLTGNFKSGWVSNEAMELKAKDRCDDHANPPQVACYYLLDNWVKFNNIDLFHEFWRKVSTTIAVTSKQNTELSGFSHNSNETGNVLKVSKLTTERYKSLGIVLRNNEEGICFTADEPFPLDLGEEYNEYEKEFMLI